jgi:hypothetical protein
VEDARGGRRKMKRHVVFPERRRADGIGVHVRRERRTAVGPETPPFNLEVILRDVSGSGGFGHVKFRQPNDDQRIIYIDAWVRGLRPNHSYYLQRAVDPPNQVDGTCSSAGWLTLGKGFALPPQPITTDGRGTGREQLWRDLDPPGPATGPQPGVRFDIHFRVIDGVTLTPVLESGCYEFAVSL